MLPELIGKRLKPWRVDLPPTWRLWQYKSLNLHRGVIHWDATKTTCTLAEISGQIRDVVRNYYRPSWWRGFGFGAIVSLSHVDDSFRSLADLIDVRNNNKGCWQWVVLHYPATRAAVGVRTWTEGYLGPVYDDLLRELRIAGFDCVSHQKEMDALMKTLTGIHQKLSITGQLLRLLRRF